MTLGDPEDFKSTEWRKVNWPGDARHHWKPLKGETLGGKGLRGKEIDSKRTNAETLSGSRSFIHMCEETT